MMEDHMPKRIFTSFAIEDESLRDLFVGQAKNEKVPYELVDMSVKEPWSDSWKTNCRIRIKGCAGVVVLITPNLKKADGAKWEILCAKQENKPIIGIYIGDKRLIDVPQELFGIKKIDWTWEGIADFVNSM